MPRARFQSGPMPRLSPVDTISPGPGEGASAPLNRAHIFTLLALATMQLVEGYDLVSMGLVASSIASEWALSPTQMGLVFAVQQLGSLAAAGLAPLVSRYLGRKALLILAMLIIASGSALTARALGFESLMALRLLTGLGLGVVATVAVGYAAEFYPMRSRAFVVAILMSSMNAGFVVGGISAAFLIPEAGWRSVLLLGALLPLLLVPVLALLPSSPVELKRRGAPARRIDAIRRRYAISAPDEAQEAAKPSGLFAVRRIVALGCGRELVTAVVTNSCAGLLVYSLTNWLPSLVLRSGLSQSASSLSSSALMAGGVIGCLASGWLMDRLSPYVVLGAMFLMSGVTLVLLSAVPATPLILLGTCALVGLFAMGAVPGTMGFVSITIPSSVRLEALGLVTMASRVAGLVAPYAAGVILDAGGTNKLLFLIAAGVATVGGVALALSGVAAYRAGRPVRSVD